MFSLPVLQLMEAHKEQLRGEDPLGAIERWDEICDYLISVPCSREFGRKLKEFGDQEKESLQNEQGSESHVLRLRHRG